MNKENKPCPVCNGTDLSPLGISCKYCNGTGVDPIKRPKENKPCPFCGSNSIGVFSSSGFIVPYNHGFVVYCQDCESNGPVAETRKEAWEKWNKRSGENER